MGKKEHSPNWVQQTDIEECLDFQRLWEILMIRLTSEAICKRIGSMMGSHGNNKIVQPKYINMEMVLCPYVRCRPRIGNLEARY